MRTQAIFLDLDGTLLDYDEAAWTETVRAVARRLSQPAGDPRVASGVDPELLTSIYIELSSRYFREAEKVQPPADGHAIWRELWGAALAASGYADAALADEAVALYAAERAASYRLYSDVLPALTELRHRVDALVQSQAGA